MKNGLKGGSVAIKAYDTPEAEELRNDVMDMWLEADAPNTDYIPRLSARP